MVRPRQLVVVADDFGIGPETNRGILELATVGRITDGDGHYAALLHDPEGNEFCVA